MPATKSYSQLLHHRPHRPRQEHPRRPVPPQDRRHHRSATSEPRRLDSMDLERERGITIRMHPVTIYHTHERSRVRTEPDRHARPRRFQLRGVAQPGRLRRASSCSSMPSRACRPRPSPTPILAMEHDLTIVPVLNKIDLPIARPDEVIAEMEQALGIEPGRRAARQRQDGHRRRRGARRPSSSACRRRPATPTTRCRPSSTTAISTPTRASSSTSASRKARLRKGQQHQADAQRHRARGHRGRPVPPGDDAVQRADRRAGRLLHGPDQRPRRRPHRRHRHRRPAARPTEAAARLQGAQADGLQRPVPGQQQRLRDPPRSAGQAQAQRRQLHLPARESARASASASAAASSACSTARSSSSASSATATSTWCRPRRTSPTRSSRATARSIIIDNPQKVPDAGQIEEFREPIVQDQLPRARPRTSAT